MKQKYYGLVCTHCGLVNSIRRATSASFEDVEFNLKLDKIAHKQCANCGAAKLDMSFVISCQSKKDGMPKLAGLRKELGAKVWMV